MTSFELHEYLNGYKHSFELAARNTLTGETRTLTVYAKDGTEAYAKGFAKLDKESGDRSWCFDGFTKESA
jgi:hypothetical protein